MSRFRGLKVNAGMNRVRVRRSIDLREMQDFGDITSSSDDLPTAGATHRASTGGSTGATRGYTDLSTVNDLVVVDTQDMGSITDSVDTVSYNDEPYTH